MGSSMLIGFNNDVEYNGQMYHIQTEDHGIKDGHITTILFYNGQILDSKKISYVEDVKDISEEEQKKVIKKKMVTIHREFYKHLFDGDYKEAVAKLISKKDKVEESVESKSKAPPRKEAVKPPSLPFAAKTKSKTRSRSNLPPVKRPAPRVVKRGREAFKGLVWPNTDMRLDDLVVKFLESV